MAAKVAVDWQEVENADTTCQFCGTDGEDVGYELDANGNIVCNECIYDMNDEEYELIVQGGGFTLG